jgi:hypothetical protein
MDKKPSAKDVYDVNKKTGALILGANRLDDYATKFLSQYCKEALLRPMPLPVDRIIEDAGLTVQTASLSRDLDVFGCCLLLDGYVQVYNQDTDTYTPVAFPAGTLVFDPMSEWIYGEGCKRNTLIHEMLHWEKDRMYFRILDAKNKKAKEQLYPIMCRQSRTNYEPPSGKRTKRNEVQWLEWQAHRLAPRILMPKQTFIKKATELIEEVSSCDELIHQLAEFFIVSRGSVKIRLLEVGLESKLIQYTDYSDVFADINKSKEYIPLSRKDAFALLKSNVILEDWVETRGFVFVDGYFVLPDKKYVTAQNGQYHLTKLARTCLPQCAINITEQRLVTYKYIQEDLANYAVLFKTEPGEIDQRIIAFSPKMQSALQEGLDNADVVAAYRNARANLDSAYDDEEEKELLRKLGDEDCSLCNCLWYLIERRGWQNGLDLNENTLIHENYYGRIKNNQKSANKMESDTLMALCVGLGLRARLTEKVFDKSENRLHLYEEPDRTRFRIMEMFPGISITDFNRMLEASDLEPLGSKDRHAN